jgi:hypothetical protein
MDWLDLLTELLETGAICVEVRISLERENNSSTRHVAHCDLTSF